MRKILVFQHVAHEILGTLNPMFKAHGFRIKYVNFGREPAAKPSLTGYAGLVILGGPMNVDDVVKHPHLKLELALIEKAIKEKMPVLGICLGAQLMAKALGAKVYKNRAKEIGWCDIRLTTAAKHDPLFSHFHEREKIFQLHGDAFDLPANAVHLASSELCENQAFCFGEKAYAFQFHLEVDAPMIHRWLKIGHIDSPQILEETPHHIERLQTLAHHNFAGFIQLFGAEKKFRGLASR